jgi:hydroxyacylglutathione hydrolase
MEGVTVDIKTISALGMNCYLVSVQEDFVLVDTGISFARRSIENEIRSAGCRPGNLRLILLTHGDVDHVGNAAYLRKKYAAKIAMHAGDLEMVESGDMFSTRPQKPTFLLQAIRKLFRLPKVNRFTPDIYLEDGQDLSAYGLEATVIHLPGHTHGSIAVLTSDGDLLCGDMYVNSGAAPSFGLGEPAQFAPSAMKLRGYEFITVYPGHGRPFPRAALYENSGSLNPKV